MFHEPADDEKKDKPGPQDSLDDEIMGKTMMDIEVKKEGGHSEAASPARKKDTHAPPDKSEESVEDLLKKEKSFLNKIGLGKLFQKKKG